MHVEDIKAALRKSGSSLAQVARELGVCRGSVSNAVTGKFRSRRIEAAIALKLNSRPEDLWPERYYKRGEWTCR